MELEPRFVDCAIVRWQSHVGRPAMLDGTSKTFEEIRSQRCERAG